MTCSKIILVLCVTYLLVAPGFVKDCNRLFSYILDTQKPFQQTGRSLYLKLAYKYMERGTFFFLSVEIDRYDTSLIKNVCT